MDMPAISIIVPTYNYARLLEKTLASINSQTLRDWECIVVDDGSTDETRTLVENLAARDGRFIYCHRVNGGAAAARNTGLERVNPASRYVAFMDADDLWSPDALELLFKQAESAPECIGAQCVADAIDADGHLVGGGVHADRIRHRLGIENGKVIPWEASRPTSFNVMVFQNFCPPGIFLIRRDVLEKTGLFDSAFAMTDDWDMQIRLSRHGAFVFLDKVLVHYRRHEVNNNPANARVVHRSLRLVRRRAFFSAENTPEQKQLARQAYRAWQYHKLSEKLVAARYNIKHGHLPRATICVVRAAGHLAFYLLGFPTTLG